MTEREFELILALGHEVAGYEFKGPGDRKNQWMFGKVARAMMGMANRRDGGQIFVGVSESGKKLLPTGLSVAQLKTWNFDDLSAAVAPYVVPNIRFDNELLVYKGKSILVLTIHEFEDIPVICHKGLQVVNSKTGKNVTVLREGALYVRSRKKPETSEVSTEADMRDLVELAVDKGIRRFASRAKRAGYAPPKSDSDLYDKEVGGTL